MIANPTQLRRELKQFVQHWGTPVTLKWLEFPGGTVDPTTGAVAGEPMQRQCDTRALVHFISPSTSASRIYGEIQTGDCIVDMAVGLLRVEDAGDTGLSAGAVVDEFALLRVNNSLGATQTPATAAEINPNSLQSLVVYIAGEPWVQQKVGAELARTWDAIFAGVKFSQSFLLRKAT